MATTLLPPDRYARAIPARRRTAGRTAPSADRALAALGRSHLRVVEGGRSATVLARRRLYRRRRIGVALVTVAVVVAVVQLLSTVRADGGVVLESGSAAPALTAVADPAAEGPVEVRPHDAGAG